jgi:hypothetical protein
VPADDDSAEHLVCMMICNMAYNRDTPTLLTGSYITPVCFITYMGGYITKTCYVRPCYITGCYITPVCYIAYKGVM